ncbi:MAG: FHA domain-containing protein, partial [Actinomycetota bacterium]|nr:FHA domain-containing protein [Actinomycetota bacterium]
MPRDVEVSAEAGTLLDDVAVALRAAAGQESAPLYAGQTPLGASARLGDPPLLDGAVLTVGTPAGGLGPRGALELRVVSGPDAGAVHRLVRGTTTVGRAPGATVGLDDPDVSRLHAVIEVDESGVRVRDLGSTNGTCLRASDATDDEDTTEVGRAAVTLPIGAHLRLGSSTLVLAPPELAPGTVHPDHEGHLLLNRPPRLLAPVPAQEVTLPQPPAERDAARFPLVMMVVPVLLGAIAYRLTGNAMTLLFVALSPVMMLATYGSDRLAGRRGNRRARQRYDAELAAARERIAASVAAEQRAARERCPDAAELLLSAREPRPRLWERRRQDADFLSLRVGTGSLPSSLTVRTRDTSSGVPETHTPPLLNVPVTVSLRDAGIVGVAGPRRRLLPLARALVGQLAGWHSPRDVEVVLLGSSPESAQDWQWAGWLPHTQATGGQDCTVLAGFTAASVAARVGELCARLDARQQEHPAGTPVSWRGRSTVVVLDGARSLRAVPAVARLLAEGPTHGIYLLCLDEDAVALPVECTTTALLAGPVATALTVRRDGAAPVEGAV